MKQDNESQWWDEEAERINTMSELAKDKAIKVVTDKPPALNPDGSLKKVLSKVIKSFKKQ